MSLALAIRVATVTWIATFFISAWLRLPWFVFFLSCCLLIIVGGLIALRYQGAERREGLVYVTAGLTFSTMILFLPPDAPFSNVDVVWFLTIFLTLGFITLVLLLLPTKTAGKEKTKIK